MGFVQVFFDSDVNEDKVAIIFECPRGPKPSYYRKHFVPLYTRIGDKKEIKLKK